jgi:uncharacterized protein (DUF302 family)
MPQASYGISRDLPELEFEQALERTIAALQAEGFGVLTDIDVQATLKKKLGVDVKRYRILGACNPPLAHQALQAEKFLGLLLPCNVIVFERDGGGAVVSAIDPAAMFSVVDNPALQPVADQVGQKLRRSIQAI